MKQFLVIVTLSLILSACATHQPLINEDNVKDSRIEISYVLGHNSYKYIATAKGPLAEITSLREDRTLERKSIPLESYQKFARKVEDLFKNPAEAHDEVDCRTPYKIEIVAKDKIRTRSGCRSSETDSNVGNVIKDGEFLFYSQK